MSSQTENFYDGDATIVQDTEIGCRVNVVLIRMSREGVELIPGWRGTFTTREQLDPTFTGETILRLPGVGEGTIRLEGVRVSSDGSTRGRILGQGPPPA